MLLEMLELRSNGLRKKFLSLNLGHLNTYHSINFSSLLIIKRAVQTTHLHIPVWVPVQKKLLLDVVRQIGEDGTVVEGQLLQDCLLGWFSAYN